MDKQIFGCLYQYGGNKLDPVEHDKVLRKGFR